MKPWVKWHRARSARFEALPVHARGLLAELLAHTDDDGWIRLGTDDRGALWRFIGAHPKERRTLAKHLDTLEQIGAVETAEEGWRLPSFDRYQDDPKSRRPSTNGTRSVHGDDTERARKRHGNEAKSPESLNTGPGDTDIEGDVDPLTPLHGCEPEGAREPEPRAERWFGHDVIEVTGAELRERGKRWQTPGLDGDAGKVRPVVDALEGVPRVTALEWCRRWARDPDTRRFTVDSLAHYVAATRNGGAGWGKRAMRRVATDAEHEAGIEAWRALGLSVMEDA